MISINNFITLYEASIVDINNDINIKVIDLNPMTKLDTKTFNLLASYFFDFYEFINGIDSDVKSLLSKEQTNVSLNSFYKNWLSNNDKLYLMYNKKEDDKLIGFSHVQLKNTALKNVPYIHELYIANNYRNFGLGKFFLNFIMTNLYEDSSVKGVMLGVMNNNEHAKQMYYSAGFKATSMKMLKLRK